MRLILLTFFIIISLFGDDFKNSIGMTFKEIPSGSFIMGRDDAFENGGEDELPMHEVTIKSFYMASTEVTQLQWVKVMGRNNPSEFKARNKPVENVSWLDAQEFIKRLNIMEGTNKYRLPTEAEWEYAARAGDESRWSFGDEKQNLDEYAWYDENSDDMTHPVGKKKPNKFGLYDMHGNVWEWVLDCYYGNYSSALTDGSAWINHCKSSSTNQPITVLRGGSWLSDASFTRSAVRYYNSADYCIDFYGFRIVKTK